jgi:hypothetical protein
LGAWRFETPAGAIAFAVVVVACARRDERRSAAPDASPEASAPAGSHPSPATFASVSAIGTATQVSPVAPALRSADGGASRCRLVRGPIGLPIKGAVALVSHGDAVDAVLDDDGRPRITTWPAGPVTVAPPSPPPPEPSSDAVVAGLTVACAVAGDRVFCPDRAGAVHVSGPGGSGDRIVASSRSGSRIAAGVAGGSHAVLAYLASRQTSEGWVSEAWIEADDAPPMRLSEDGSGATSVALAPRGPALVALMVDARAALTALHARPVTYDGGLRLGEDAVISVGGPGDRRTAAALALPPSGAGWALLPIPKDVGAFGLSIVRVEDPPRVDEPITWSMYPNGLDPAPVAAVVDGGRTWVARIRPESAAPAAPRVLELGEVRSPGTFEPLEVLGSHGAPSDTALIADAHGALWVAWVDPSGSWVERLACAHL